MSPTAKPQKPQASLTLQEWLDLTETSYSAFAREVPCHITYPGKVIRGEAQPSYRMARRFEQITGGAVSRTLWYPAEDEPEDQEPAQNQDTEL